MVSWKNWCLFVTALTAWAVEQMWRCQSQGMLKYKFHSNPDPGFKHNQGEASFKQRVPKYPDLAPHSF